MRILEALVFKMNQFFLALILSILPISELRVGLPLAVDYALKNSLPIFPLFFLIVLLNIIIIFPILFFLDYLHENLMKFSLYRSVFGILIRQTRKKIDKVERKLPIYGYFALTLFVAIPLPVTGAWTGCLIAWILGLERKRAVPAIALGVMIAGIIVLLASLGVLSLFSLL